MSDLRENVELETRALNAYVANRCGECKLKECSGFECLIGLRAAIAVCMEEAAKVAYRDAFGQEGSPRTDAGHRIAAAIRSLKGGADEPR